MARLLRSIGDLRWAGKGTAKNDAKHGMQLKGTWLHFVGTEKQKAVGNTFLVSLHLLLETILGAVRKPGQGRLRAFITPYLQGSIMVVVCSGEIQFQPPIWSWFVVNLPILLVLQKWPCGGSQKLMYLLQLQADPSCTWVQWDYVLNQSKLTSNHQVQPMPYQSLNLPFASWFTHPISFSSECVHGRNMRLCPMFRLTHIIFTD